MSIPIVRHLSSPDLEQRALPPDPSSCAIPMTAEIGPPSGGAELFSFIVATPDRVLGDGHDARWGRGYMLVERFSWEAVERMLSKLVLHADREDWEASARELAKELHWEFENYSDAHRK
jgi:hypothetical protein